MSTNAIDIVRHDGMSGREDVCHRDAVKWWNYDIVATFWLKEYFLDWDDPSQRFIYRDGKGVE